MQGIVSFVVVLLVAFCHSHSVAEIGGAEIHKASTKAMQYLGTWENKNYYYGTVLKTWDQAKAECEADNMEILTINFNTELEAVKNMLSSAGYWTSARDTNAFKWEGGSGSVVEFPFTQSTFQCMAMSYTGLFVATCTQPYYPLCQI